MANTQEISAKRQKLSDLEFLLVSLQGRLERNQQELATDQKLLATIDDTIPKIQRAIAKRQAAGDTAGAAQAQRDLDESIRDREQLSGNIAQLQNRITSGQEAVTNAQQDIRSLQSEIAAAQTQGSGAVSAGDTTAAAQQANAQGADTQSPQSPAQQANSTGSVEPIDPATVPSNAAPSQSLTPTTTASPSKLPPGTAAPAANTTGAAQIAPGSQSPAAATQQGGANLDTPDENTNRVSYIYRAYQVTSTFRQGKFTQDVQGAQIFFPIAPQSSSQQTPDAARTAPKSLSAAETARLQRQAGSSPQGTVAQSAATAGVPISSPAAPGLLELEGFGDPTVPPVYPAGGRSPSTQTTLPGSSFAAEGFGDPTTEQVPATAPLTTAPVSPNVATRPSADAQATQGVSGNTSVEDQLRLARNNKTQFERALADVEARIQRGEGNALANRQMRSLYADNLRTENRIIADLEKQQQSRPAPSAPNTTVAPQQGAREY